MLQPISRRRFLQQLTVIGGTALIPPLTAQADAPVTVAQVRWVPLGPAGKFHKGSYCHIVLPDAYNEEEIYVIQQDNGSYLALLARCTHKGCVVDWQNHDEQFHCPCHGGRFDAAGKNVGGPPPRPLRKLQTKIDGDTLSVEAP